jgi:hypothetical protein
VAIVNCLNKFDLVEEKMKILIVLMMFTAFFGCSHQVSQIERKVAQEDVDSEAEAIRDNSKPKELFTDSEGRSWSTLRNFKVDYTEAKKYCKKHGLKLPGKSLVERMEDELNQRSKEGLLVDWFWTSTTRNEKAWAVYVYSEGRGLGYSRVNIDGGAYPAVCIDKE